MGVIGVHVLLYTSLNLPGGVEVMLYEPRHPVAIGRGGGE